jgi:hypothetical protein
MAKKLVLAAGVLSLIVVGTWERVARADKGAFNPDPEPGIVRLFGKTLCFSQAPITARCDWRMPDPEGRGIEPEPSHSFTLLGRTFCWGGSARAGCDFTFPNSEPEQKSRVVELFGLTLCFGDTSPSSQCDVKFLARPEQQHDERASL